MQYTSYRDEMEKMSFYIFDGKGPDKISNYMVLMFDLMKKIAKKFKRVRGYVGYISRGKNPQSGIDAMSTLLDIMIDNKINIEQKYQEDFSLLQKYLGVILNNLDEYIQENPNIIYDEEEKLDPLLKIDLFGESFRLISHFCGEFAT